MITYESFFNEHPTSPQALSYALDLLKQAEPDSNFVKKNAELINAIKEGNSDHLKEFKAKKYNALLIYSDGEIIGHAGYQHHFQDNLSHLGIIQGYLVEGHRSVSNLKALLKGIVEHGRLQKADRLRFSRKHKSGITAMKGLRRWNKTFGTVVDMENWWAYLLQKSDEKIRQLCPSCFRDVIYIDGVLPSPVCPKGHITSNTNLVTLINGEVNFPQKSN
ncbi:MAG: hypothetical protein ABIH72_05210 [archaeon]